MPMWTPCARLVGREHEVKGNCANPALRRCSKCQLVGYCSRDCQVAHWPIHKLDCNSGVPLDSWQPRWATEGRRPTFLSDEDEPSETFGVLKYLFGNTPAVDILALPRNEGADYDKPLSVCFAASGDIRNIVMTINNLPETYKEPLTVYVNDLEIDVAIRSAILLILALSDTSDEVVDCMIHVWYSAMIKQSHYDMLRQYVRPWIAKVALKIKNRDDDDDLFWAKTFFINNNSSLRLILKKQHWLKFLEVLDRIQDLDPTPREAASNRCDITFHRVDHNDRHLFNQPSWTRVALVKYLVTGIVIPFGASPEGFHLPNPTLFDSDWRWMQNDLANPLDGWWQYEKSPLNGSVDGPTNDPYGYLAALLRQHLSGFVSRCQSQPVHFVLTACDIQKLPELIPKDFQFDRIEVSNVLDAHHLGIHKTLSSLKPFVRKSNSSSAIIGLFMNAVGMIAYVRKPPMLFNLMQQVKQILPMDPNPEGPYDPGYLRRLQATDCLLPCDEWFADYVTLVDMDRRTKDLLGFERRRPNTVIDEWPWRLKRNEPIEAQKQNLIKLLASGNSGFQRFVEWVLV